MWVKTKFGGLINLTRTDSIFIRSTDKQLSDRWVVLARSGEHEMVLTACGDPGKAAQETDRVWKALDAGITMLDLSDEEP